MQKFRGFIAIEIDNFPKIKQLEREIKKTNSKIKSVELKNIHITLKFLGDTSEDQIGNIENIMKNVIKDIEPFDIILKGVGVFPNRKYIKIIWIGILQGKPIIEIASRIDKQLTNIGFKREKKVFSPHLTIARVRSLINKNEILHIIDKYEKIEFGKLKVNSIKLKKSELTAKGPIYTDIKEIKLKGG